MNLREIMTVLISTLFHMYTEICKRKRKKARGWSLIAVADKDKYMSETTLTCSHIGRHPLRLSPFDHSRSARSQNPLTPRHTQTPRHSHTHTDRFAVRLTLSNTNIQTETLTGNHTQHPWTILTSTYWDTEGALCCILNCWIDLFPIRHLCHMPSG